jgi:hypothetical protein
MNYFIIKYASGAVGCPVLVHGRLNPDWEWDLLDPHPEKITIKNHYLFKVKQKKIDFDYWNDHSIASAEFLQIVRAHGANPRAVPLEIIESTGKKQAKIIFTCYGLIGISPWTWIDPAIFSAGTSKRMKSYTIIIFRICLCSTK